MAPNPLLSFLPFIILVAFGFIVGSLAKRKNRNGILWGIFGVFFFLISLIILAFLPIKENVDNSNLTKDQIDSKREQEKRTNKIIIGVIIGIVLFIILIIIAVSIPKFLDLSDSAKIATCKQNITQIESALAISYAQNAINNDARYVSTLDSLKILSLIPEIPTCPSGGTYTIDKQNGTVTCSINNHNIR
jgi:hypothetical protein